MAACPDCSFQRVERLRPGASGNAVAALCAPSLRVRLSPARMPYLWHRRSTLRIRLLLVLAVQQSAAVSLKLIPEWSEAAGLAVRASTEMAASVLGAVRLLSDS